MTLETNLKEGKMAKYDPLRDYLREKPPTTTRVTLTFEEIERIIGQDMEPSAHTSFTSWDNRSPGRQASWLNARWKTIMVDLENDKVKFQRQ